MRQSLVAYRRSPSGAMTASASHLASFADELQRKLANQGRDMPPNYALFFLRQITGFAEGMAYLSDMVKVRELLKPCE